MNAVNYDALGAKITKAFAEAGLRPLRAIRELDTLFNELIKDK